MPNHDRLNKHPARLQTTPVPPTPGLLYAFRDYALTTPSDLPMPWSDLSKEAKEICMWYVRNTMSPFAKVKVARHIIGCEIIANESAGVNPNITQERFDEIWAYVLSKQS